MVVQARLGHKSAEETLYTYSHLWPDSADRTRDAIDAVCEPTMKEGSLILRTPKRTKAQERHHRALSEQVWETSRPVSRTLCCAL